MRLSSSASRVHGEVIQLAFQRAEEALDASVLPWAVPVGALRGYAEQAQTETEQTRGEYRLVVGANEAGLAVALDGGEQDAESVTAALSGSAIKARLARVP